MCQIYDKSDDAKSMVNKCNYMNMNVIEVMTVIILNYGYGRNSIEQCTN